MSTLAASAAPYRPQDNLSFNVEIVDNGAIVRAYGDKDGADLNKTTVYAEYETYRLTADIGDAIVAFRAVTPVVPPAPLSSDDDVPF